MGARISLLWPDGGAGRGIGRRTGRDTAAGGSVGLDDAAARDLALATLVDALAVSRSAQPVIGGILRALSSDAAVIRYRQDVLQDLLDHPALAARLEQISPQAETLAGFKHRVDRRVSLLQEVIWRIGELEVLVDAVTALHGGFSEVGDGDGVRSQGLRALAAQVASLAAEPAFLRMTEELPGLAAQVRASASVTIGVNLDERLQPAEATLLSVNDRKFSGGKLLARLFGIKEGEGIGPLHVLPRDLVDASGTRVPVEPGMVPLFRDLAVVLEKTAQPVARALERYVTLNGAFLADLGEELPFYLGAVRLATRFREAGLPICRPELAPADERVCQVAEGYNPVLALHLLGAGQAGAVVTNEINFSLGARVFILTGPNQGGKTTYIQGVGLIQVMAQAGLFAPGRVARISPVDAVLTHFPVEEDLERATGRFGDEAQRLREIFNRATRHSLVLLNETLSSTGAGEGLYLGQDIVRALRLLGARAVFSTHLHELAGGIDELNRDTRGDSVIASLVASPVEQGAGGDGVQRSYRVVAAPPMGRSYAREVAERYGVGYEQLTELLRGRGVIG